MAAKQFQLTLSHLGGCDCKIFKQENGYIYANYELCDLLVAFNLAVSRLSRRLNVNLRCFATILGNSLNREKKYKTLIFPCKAWRMIDPFKNERPRVARGGSKGVWIGWLATSL